MKRADCEALLADILATPHPGELQVALHGVERLGTRFNDCAISQNTLKHQYSLTLSARLGQKKTSLSINDVGDRERIRRSIEQVFANCAHMPDDDELMPPVKNGGPLPKSDIDKVRMWIEQGAICPESLSSSIA